MFKFQKLLLKNTFPDTPEKLKGRSWSSDSDCVLCLRHYSSTPTCSESGGRQSIVLILRQLYSIVDTFIIFPKEKSFLQQSKLVQRFVFVSVNPSYVKHFIVWICSKITDTWVLGNPSLAENSVNCSYTKNFINFFKLKKFVTLGCWEILPKL